MASRLLLTTRPLLLRPLATHLTTRTKPALANRILPHHNLHGDIGRDTPHLASRAWPLAPLLTQNGSLRDILSGSKVKVTFFGCDSIEEVKRVLAGRVFRKGKRASEEMGAEENVETYVQRMRKVYKGLGMSIL